MIDLHTHTTCSDGTDSPRELVNKAIVQGIEVLGITDHDTTSGWEEATQSLRGSLQLVLGAEISCLTNDGISVHMLGLLFDPLHEEMQQVLEETRDGRLPRMRKMIEKMRAEGMDISIEDVENAITAGLNMVKELGLKKYKYEYKPIVYTPQTVMNSLLQFQDDEEIEDYPVHQLESIDVIEEKDGITISDIFDGNNLFINDDDLVYLYEILKERLISKY